MNYEAKYDQGKPQISLVPMQIVKDIARVRTYGNEKYGDPNNWKTVEKQRYVDALMRHLINYIDDPKGVDEESGIPHYMHAACNLAFICSMEETERSEDLKKEKSIEKINKEMSELAIELTKNSDLYEKFNNFCKDYCALDKDGMVDLNTINAKLYL